jgi:serine/threonine protein kinase
VRIADFGLSHSFSSGGVQEKVLIGTPAYMAPETLISNDYSYKCDVWALGNIFVEMLTGKAPFMNSMTIDQLKGLFLGGVRLRLDNISGRSCQLVDSMLKIRK